MAHHWIVTRVTRRMLAGPDLDEEKKFSETMGFVTSQ
jgi:hypothetical protein